MPTNILLGLVARDEGPELVRTIVSFMESATPPERVAVILDGPDQPEPASVIDQIPAKWRSGVHVERAAHARGPGPTRQRLSQITQRGEVLVLADAHITVPWRWGEDLWRLEGIGPLIMAWPLVSRTGSVCKYDGVYVQPTPYLTPGPISDPGRGKLAPLRGPHGAMLAMNVAAIEALDGYCPDLLPFGNEEGWLAVRAAAAGVPVWMTDHPVTHLYREEGLRPEPAFIWPSWTNAANWALYLAYVHGRQRVLEELLPGLARMHPQMFTLAAAAHAATAVSESRQVDRWVAWFDSQTPGLGAIRARTPDAMTS
jgi:hypothetical protein